MTTVDPRPRVRPKDSAPPPGMDTGDKARLRKAANWAGRIGLGAIGELITRELNSAHEFGYRLGDQSLVYRVVVEVEARMAAQEKERANGTQSTPRG